MIDQIPDITAKRAELSPNSVAFEEVATGRVWSYGQLDHRAGQLASLLAARGITPGDRVAILCRNRVAFFELLFGCAKLGAILVPLNWRMPPAELAQLVADAAPSLLLFGAEDEAAAAMLGIERIGLDLDYEATLAVMQPYPARAHWPAADTWYLLYTSGTTGASKGVIYTYRMALANYVNLRSAIDLRSTDSTANFLPLFHTAGINLHALPTLLAGGSVLVLPGFDEEALIALFEARRLDVFFAVPAVYQALLSHPRFATLPLDAVRHWGCGGAPLPDQLVERCRALGIRVCNGMGMTETGPTAFLIDPADAWDRIGSVGKPQLLCSVRIVNQAGRDVPDGAEGDLLFAGPGVTPGYWRNPQETAAAFTADGWLRSGDIARRDEDGFCYISGRRKEMFVSGGENVFPAEVENVLCAHPAVAEVAVVAAPDPRWAEVGRAFILPIPGVAALDYVELESFCRARLAPYKVPKYFEIVSDFPRTAAGKIRKHLLVEEPQPLRAIGGR
ncbi:MAG TPA: AMP-binding protein [Allosphingosinicella sp.]|uniref:AMP-binding protein n=1 Tax=Allosphingosinicella sp. TaxID=2823234 RepID=UPI002F281A45